MHKWRRDRLADGAQPASRPAVSPLPFLAHPAVCAIAAAGLIIWPACERAETTPQRASASAPAAAGDDRVVAAQAQLDAVAARLDQLARRAESAGGDPQALLPVADEFDREIAASRTALALVARGLSDGDQRALQAHYGLRVGPPLSRLQVLLFPVHLARLPAGATAAAAGVTATQSP